VQILVLFTLAIATSLDSLSVGVAYGLSGTRVRLAAHAVISTVMMAITWTAVALGNQISRYLPEFVAHLLSALFFVGIGIWILAPMFRRRPLKEDNVASDLPAHAPTLTQVLENPLLADQDASREIDIRESLLLGVALSLNNIGGGVSAGLIRLSPFWMAFWSVFFNVVCLTGGHLLGNCLSKSRLGDYTQALSGVLMVVIGLWQLH
jgi:putative sporulation protein YtaF